MLKAAHTGHGMCQNARTATPAVSVHLCSSFDRLSVEIQQWNFNMKHLSRCAQQIVSRDVGVTCGCRQLHGGWPQGSGASNALRPCQSSHTTSRKQLMNCNLLRQPPSSHCCQRHELIGCPLARSESKQKANLCDFAVPAKRSQTHDKKGPMSIAGIPRPCP